MTKTERDELSTAIDLIQSLRSETQLGFQHLREELTSVRERQTAHLAQHEASEKQSAKDTNRSRWAISLALASLGSVVTAMLALLRTLQVI